MEYNGSHCERYISQVGWDQDACNGNIDHYPDRDTSKNTNPNSLLHRSQDESPDCRCCADEQCACDYSYQEVKCPTSQDREIAESQFLSDSGVEEFLI